MGYQYELLQDLADHIDIELEIAQKNFIVVRILYIFIQKTRGFTTNTTLRTQSTLSAPTVNEGSNFASYATTRFYLIKGFPAIPKGTAFGLSLRFYFHGLVTV